MAELPVLVTGGAGFIGSHTCLRLLEAGHPVVVLDNFSNSSREALSRVERLAGKPLQLVEGDVREPGALDRAFSHMPVGAVIHFAGLKAVGESVERPLFYYDNNVGGTLRLLEAMARHGCQRLVFSSSATVYAETTHLPIIEDAPCAPKSPYGRTKLMVEEILSDAGVAAPALRILSLRYFNPVGAHPSGTIGEDPRGIPSNLMPFLMQVAVGRRERLEVFGGDYSTPDGTGVRDYLHVMDLADGHLAALAALDRTTAPTAINLGTGTGHSVLEVLHAASHAVGRELPYRIGPRRPGDAASVYADPSRAKALLGWQARRSLAEMCADAWRWQQQNPNGYS